MEFNMFSIHSLNFSNHVILDRAAVDPESVGGSTRQPISFGGISREPEWGSWSCEAVMLSTVPFIFDIFLGL